MKMKKSIVAGIAAMLVGLNVGGYTTPAYAAEAVESAAADDMMADVPRDHWAYQALDYLVQAGVIEGNPDGTFEGDRTLTRYEMAAIVAKAMKNGSGKLADRAMVEKLNREFGKDIKKLSQQIKNLSREVETTRNMLERVKFSGDFRVNWDNDSDNYQDKTNGAQGRNEKENNKFYLDLRADMKINKEWTAHLQSETKQHFGHDTTGFGYLNGDQNESGGFVQRAWATGNFKNGMNIEVGRKKVDIGMQSSLYGDATSGISVDWKINKQGLRAGAFYHTMTEHKTADSTFWGPYVKGSVGHSTDIYAAYARVDTKLRGKFKNPAFNEAVASGKYDWTGSGAVLLSAGFDLDKNFRLTTDYVHTNAAAAPNTSKKSNETLMARLDYKKADPEKKGSYSLYARYHTIGREGTIWNDDDWGSLMRNSRGWTFGVKYVPTKNVIWETFYEKSTANKDAYDVTWGISSFNRNLFRTKVDFLF